MTGRRVCMVGWLLVLFALVGGCEKKAEANKPGAAATAATRDPVAVTLGSTAVRPVQRSVPVIGTLYGNEDATISAKVAGRVTAVYQDVGDRIMPGQALAQIEQVDYELARVQRETALRSTLAKMGLDALPAGAFDPTQLPTVVRAKRQADNAEAKLKRGKTLFEQKPPLISEQDYADLQTTFDVAKSDYDVEVLTVRSTLAEALSRKSDLDAAVQRLADTTVRAPGEAGTVATTSASSTRNSSIAPRNYAVAARMVSVGEYVREGTPLFRLVADDPIKFRADVPERYVARVSTGQTVHVTVDAYPDQPFTGTVSRISPQVDPANRMFQVEVLVENARGLLKPGGFGRGSILTHVDPQVMFVPRESVLRFAGIRKVFSVKDGKAVEHIIEADPGTREDEWVEVTSGLSGVQPVVIGGVTKLAAGVPVEVKESATTRPATTRARRAE